MAGDLFINVSYPLQLFQGFIVGTPENLLKVHKSQPGIESLIENRNFPPLLCGLRGRDKHAKDRSTKSYSV